MRQIFAALMMGITCTTAGQSENIVVELRDGVAMEFVWIEPGTFLMGSPASAPTRGEDEGPQHEVSISKGFYLGKFEITQAQWVVVMGTAPWTRRKYVRAEPNHPAVYISWVDMQEFLRRLNEAAARDLYRLPTEAEWEYACRAGTTTSRSFGDDESQLGDYAWYIGNGGDARGEICPVGGFKAAESVGSVRYARQCMGVGARLVPQRLFKRQTGGPYRSCFGLYPRHARGRLCQSCPQRAVGQTLQL